MEGGCGGVKVRNKVEKKRKREKEKERKDEKRICGCFETFRHSFSFSLLLNQIISITHPPIPPKYLSLSLIVDEHTNTHLPHSHLSYKSTTIHVLTRIQITPQFLILLQTTHSISSPNNHFSCYSSKSISSSILSHSSHWTQECD